MNDKSLLQSTAVGLCSPISPLFAGGSGSSHISCRKQPQYLGDHFKWQRRCF